MQHLSYRGQKSKTHNLLFLFQTHVLPCSKVKVINPRMAICTPSKVITMQSLKDLALTVSKKTKANVKYFFK